MLSSVSVEAAELATRTLSSKLALSKAPLGQPLCARSLAAFEAASPYNSSCSTTRTGTDLSVTRGLRVKRADGGRAVRPTSEKVGAMTPSDSAGSTDEGSFSDAFEDSTSQDSPIECCLADLSGDSSSTDNEGSVEDDSALASSVPQTFTSLPSKASFKVYPVTLLLQLRASICGTSGGDSCSSALGYSTRSASECPSEVESASQCSDVDASVRVGHKLSWSAQQRKTSYAQGDNEQVARTARSILNKLTIEKFDALYEQLATCGVSTPEHVKLLMQEIFEKATVQHHFLGMYADLCVKLESDPRIAPAVEAEGRPNGFRRLLLSQCQTAFEHQFDAHGKSLMDDEELLQRKQRALGNVKFVGKLIVRGMLSSKLLCCCAEVLLGEHTACNEALESLAALLTVVGATFDVPNFLHMQRLEAIFSRVSDIVRDVSVPARLRFLLRDVLELRQAGWPHDARPATKTSGPMRLEEVRATAPKSPGIQRSPNSSGSPVAKAVREAPIESSLNPGRRTKGTHRRAAHASQSSTVGTCAFKCEKSGVDVASNASGSPCVGPMLTAKDIVCKSVPPPAVAALEVVPMPSSDVAAEENIISEPFSLAAFRRELSATMKELSSHRNVAASVRRIRAQNVPLEHQAQQFADLITRAAEEIRGPVRRTAFAFCGGLAAAEQSAFGRAQCLAGVSIFFKEIYQDLCEEVSKLPSIVTAELLPTLQTVLPPVELNALLPKELQFRVPHSSQLKKDQQTQH